MGLLSSVYGAVQLLSSPFMGLLSDRYGRKLVILIGYGGSMAGYALLSGSTSVRLVVASRIITGLLKHSQNAMRALVVDHTTRANRSVQLGRLATMSGLGIMVGPTLGGFLYKLGGSSLPMLLASLLYVANCLIVAAYLPQDAAAASATKRSPHLLPNLAMLGRGRVAALFAVRVVMGLAVQTFRQGFAIQTLYRFNLGVRENGFLISYQGALSSLVQGVAMKPLTRRYDDHTLLRRGMVVVALSFAAASLTPNLLLLVLLLAPVALTTGVLRTTYASVLTASVPSDEVRRGGGRAGGGGEGRLKACPLWGLRRSGKFWASLMRSCQRAGWCLRPWRGRWANGLVTLPQGWRGWAHTLSHPHLVMPI